MKVSPKKKLGQHFLNDLNIAEKIALTLKNHSFEEIVEIGPGTGALTQFLIKHYDQKLSVVEIDSESVEYLKQKYTQNEFQIVDKDFLKLDFSGHFKDSIAIIGNFPYNISSQILFKALEERQKVPLLSGMFQKEVAERVCADPGNKTYGILSVLIQAFYDTQYLFTVHENVFTPPPKVKSGVMIMTRKEKEPDCNHELLFKIVKAGFNQRRKKLSNGLKTLNLTDDLSKHPFMDKRPEQLSIEDFITLTKSFG